jgi:hypothetical protein
MRARKHNKDQRNDAIPICIVHARANRLEEVPPKQKEPYQGGGGFACDQTATASNILGSATLLEAPNYILACCEICRRNWQASRRPYLVRPLDRAISSEESCGSIMRLGLWPKLYLPACTDALPPRQRDRSETIPVRHGSCPRASVLMKDVVCRCNSRRCWEKVRTQNHSRDVVLADVRKAVGHPVAAGRSLRRGVEMAARR